MPIFALLFSMIWSAIVGAAGGAAAAGAAWLILTAIPAGRPFRRTASVTVFVGTALLFGCYTIYQRWTPQPVSEAVLYEAVPGLRDAEASIVASEDSAGLDSATTYVQLQGPRRAAQRIAAGHKLVARPGNAKEIRFGRDDSLPAWWPSAPCSGGQAYEPGEGGRSSLEIDGALDASISLYDCPSANAIFVVFQRRW